MILPGTFRFTKSNSILFLQPLKHRYRNDGYEWWLTIVNFCGTTKLIEVSMPREDCQDTKNEKMIYWDELATDVNDV